jgi:hypothetical protein
MRGMGSFWVTRAASMAASNEAAVVEDSVTDDRDKADDLGHPKPPAGPTKASTCPSNVKIRISSESRSKGSLETAMVVGIVLGSFVEVYSFCAN